MRVLHVVKTADGGAWAALLAAELVALGVEVHVALPREEGLAVEAWIASGAILHLAPTDLALGHTWSLPGALRRLRELVSQVRPDLIHSHFVSSTVLLRLALGKDFAVPRVFQAAGPLHLESPLWRRFEIGTACGRDFWIASSRATFGRYRAAGVPGRRLYLSYPAVPVQSYSTTRSGVLRRRYGLAGDTKIVGNANYIYPPKWYLGQRVGLKAHEDVIDALGLLIRRRADVVGLLIGGSLYGAAGYARRLRERARALAGDRIIMAGYLPAEDIRQAWPDFDVAVHVPLSENCGGVVEPLLAGVPTVAGQVGGLPEVVIPEVTGALVPIRRPEKLARQVEQVLDTPTRSAELARNGQALARRMFAPARVAREVYDIYRHVLGIRKEPPEAFDPVRFLQSETHSDAYATR